MNIEIYTDWSCLWNPWKWWRAYLLKFKDKQKTKAGQQKDTTNNQMELTAIIKALQELKTYKYPLKIYTDSHYVKNWITKRIKKWKYNNRQTSNKTNVKNKELWEKLDKLTSNFKIERHWVKAHATNKNNNLVDELARKKSESIS